MGRTSASLILLLLIAFSVSTDVRAAKLNSEVPPGVPAGVAESRQFIFEILKVDGSVNYWLPLGNQWHEMVPGIFLPFGTIVQIQDGGNIDYRFYKKLQDKWFGDQAYLRFKSAVSFRLDSDIVRSSNLTEQLLETPPKIDPNQKKPTKQELAYDALGYAWNRLVAYMNLTKENKDYITDLLSAPQQEVELGFRAKKIKLLKPEHGAAVFAFQFPMKIKLAWQTKDEISGPYGIHIWQGAEPRPGPSFEVVGDQFDLLITKPGSYFVQISAMNGRYLSPPHTVHVGNYVEDDETVDDWLQARFPLQNMTLVSETPRHNVDISWYVNEKADFKYLNLHLRTLKGKAAVREFKLNKNISHYEIKLPKGEYIWWVEAEVILEIPGQAPKSRILKTEPCLFSVLPKKNQASQIRKLLSKAMKDQKTKRVYLESGL